MIAFPDRRQRFILHLLPFAEDLGQAIGLEQQGAFFANHHRVIGADLVHRRQPDRRERWNQTVIVVMHHKLLAGELAATRIGDGAEIVRGVGIARWLRRVRDDRFGRRHLVGEIEQVQQMAAPVRQLAPTRFPERAPTPGREILAVRQVGADGPAPQIPIHILRHGLGGRVLHPRIGEVVTATDAAGPDVGLHRPAQLVVAQNFHGQHPAAIAGALIAHLRDELGPHLEGVANHAQLVELLHQRLLAIDVFAVFERGEHHRRVVMIRHVHDHRVEIGQLVGERFAVILRGPCVGKFLADGLQFTAVHIAKARPFHVGMPLEAAALHAADAAVLGAHTDLKDAELAVLVGLGPRAERKRRKTGGGHGTRS